EQFTLAGIRFSVDSAPGLSACCDHYRIEQVLANLFANALKYGAGAPVEVKLLRSGLFARIEVRDHGPGIRHEDLERIFLRFERAVSSRSVSGLGLGLYISRRIAEAHGGRLWAESQPGNGASF